MAISASKQRRSLWEQANIEPPIMLRGQPLEEVESFTYLGSEINQSNKAEKETLMMLEKAGKGKSSKVVPSALPHGYAYQTLVMPVLLYGAETWTVT